MNLPSLGILATSSFRPAPEASRISVGNAFEVQIPAGLAVTGVVLADQVKSLDWRARDAERMCALPAKVMAEVLGKLNVLLAE